MDLFLDYPLTSLFVLAVMVWIAIALVRKSGAMRAGVTCAQCGTKLPAVAKFCRTCGHEVK